MTPHVHTRERIFDACCNAKQSQVHLNSSQVLVFQKQRRLLQIPRQRVGILAVELFEHKVLMIFSYLIPMCNILEILVAFVHDDKVVVCSLVFGQVGQGLSVRCFAKLQFVLSSASWRMTLY